MGTNRPLWRVGGGWWGDVVGQAVAEEDRGLDRHQDEVGGERAGEGDHRFDAVAEESGGSQGERAACV